MLVVVSHDAGGAEILSDWVRSQSEPYLLVLAGPAKAIFERKLGKVSSSALRSAIDEADWVLTGTGWQSDMEKEAIDLARRQNKKSISFLDHWVNYKQRL